MKVGVIAVVFGRVQGMGVMKAFAARAEQLGFASLWAPEYVCAGRPVQGALSVFQRRQVFPGSN